MAASKKTASVDDDFAPKGYEVPSSGGNYMKFKDGKNKFRFLSSPVMGYEYWTEDKKCIRSKEEFTSTPGIKIENDGKESKVSHFWAAVVYNYTTEKIETLEITQKGIQKYILGLLNDEDWGSPKGYDLVVTREGEGFNTKYTVAANPHKDLDPDILTEYENCGIDLEKLFDEN